MTSPPDPPRLFDLVVKLHNGLLSFETSRMTHNLFVSATVEVGFDVGFGGQLGIGDKFMGKTDRTMSWVESMSPSSGR